MTLGAVAWAMALAAAPYLAAGSFTGRRGLFAAGVVYVAGSIVCHQQPARSAYLWSTQVPVCARCFGLYAGAACGAVAALAWATSRRWRRRRDGPPDSFRAWRIALAASAVPTAITAGFEFLLGANVGNSARLWAGVPLGAAVAWIVVSALEGGGTVERRSPEVNCADAHPHERAGHRG